MVGIPLTRPNYHGCFRDRVVGTIETALARVDVDSEIFLSPATKAQGLAGVLEATNYLAQKCLDEDRDRLWIVKADVEVPKHSLTKLLYEGDINLGIYPNHRQDLRMMAGYFQESWDRVKPEVKSVFQYKAACGSGFFWDGLGWNRVRINQTNSL